MTQRIRTLIVDDEPLALSILRAKLEKNPQIEIIGECRNGREAIATTMELAPDLLFLDIQMPGLDGFEVIKRLQSDIMPLVVFTTAYEQYALDAFEVHAVDYILKPIDEERVTRSVERAERRLQLDERFLPKHQIMGAINDINEQESAQQERLSSRTAQGLQPEAVDNKVVIKDRDEITLLKQTDIAWVDAAGDYCCLHANGETHIKRSTLKDLLDELDPGMFKRVHRSTIVNLNFIEKVLPHTKGEFFLQLGDQDRVKVSRNYKDVIKAFLSSS